MSNNHKKTEKRKLYLIWYSMNSRCFDEKNKKYIRYGGRGITVCDEWNYINKNNFNNFYNWAVNNGYTVNSNRGQCMIDRVNNDKGYSPDNCRWTNNKQQCRNMGSNINISYNGEIHCLVEWCDILGLPYKTIYSRLHRLNFTVEEAFSKPIKNKINS